MNQLSLRNNWLKLKTSGNDQSFRGIYGMYLKLVKKNRTMSTWNRLDLGTLGSRLIMPKNLPGHYWRARVWVHTSYSHTARLLQLLNVEHQTSALIDQSMSPIGSQNYGSWALCKVLAYPHPTAGRVYFQWVAGIRERSAGINHVSGKGSRIYVYFYIRRACEIIVGACFGTLMFHSTYHCKRRRRGRVKTMIAM